MSSYSNSAQAGPFLPFQFIIHIQNSLYHWWNEKANCQSDQRTPTNHVSPFSIEPNPPCATSAFLCLFSCLYNVFGHFYYQGPWISTNKQSRFWTDFAVMRYSQYQKENRKAMWSAFGILIESLFYRIANTWIQLLILIALDSVL